MFSQKFLDDSTARSRSKFPLETASQRTLSTRCSSVKRHAQQLFKPWFAGTNTATAGAAAAATAAAAALQAGTPLSVPTRNNSTAPLPDSANNFTNVSNTAAGGSAPDFSDRPINKDDIRPMPYHDYNPIVVRQTQSDQELPIHYWFYVYLYSSDVDKLLTPFVKMVDSFGADRRLTVIMNRCGVQILLKELELYKSLPRRIVVIKGSQWTNIVKALLEMEERLPDLMRFATFPLLLDTDTTKYACTKFDRTACVNRLSRLIN